MSVDIRTALGTLMVVAVITALIRALPYLVFGRMKKIPKTIHYLGNVLPGSIMVILVLYCLRNTEFISYPFGLPEIIAVVIVILSQWVKKNTFFSVLLGTLCYMILIRVLV